MTEIHIDTCSPQVAPEIVPSEGVSKQEERQDTAADRIRRTIFLEIRPEWDPSTPPPERTGI